MTAVGQWRATYAPGNWLVLAGPASVVVLEPPGDGWTALVAELWQQVLAARSMVDLAARLAVYGLDTMPSFGALFWTPDGMRSLVRGGVRVADPATGRVLADGDGIQTWHEVGLGELREARIETAGGPQDRDALELPLVVGAVRASWVLLDAREEARVHSPQAPALAIPDATARGGELTQPTEPIDPPTPLGAEPTTSGDEPVGSDGGSDPARAGEEEVEVEPTTVLPDPPEELQTADTALMTIPPGLDGHDPDVSTGPTVEAVLCPQGHPNPPGADACRTCGAPVPEGRPRPVARPVLAMLRATDGREAPLDRAVLVGRAPVDRGDTGARLLTVPSPGHDISRTHLRAEPDGWRIVVTDLNSTNGTVLVGPGGRDRRLLPPGEPVSVDLGSALELADGVAVVVDRPR